MGRWMNRGEVTSRIENEGCEKSGERQNMSAQAYILCVVSLLVTIEVLMFTCRIMLYMFMFIIITIDTYKS